MNQHKVNPIALAAVAALSLSALPAAQAQNAQTMAPPVTASGGSSASSFDPNANASQSVYSWHDVPVGQKVTIVRAVFDQGGYQLYDDKGETIVIPFVNQNLYVMRFGRSDGDTYFINDGSTPTLFLPRGGYLTNSAAQGSRWYPFDKNYSYNGPVYEGPAPSWDAYVDMAWYPGMAYYGGYWGYHPWAFGLAFSPMPGLYFNIGGSPYYGWGAYHSYYYGHPYNRFYVHNAVAFNHYNVGHRAAGTFGTYHGGVANRGGFGHTASFGRATSVRSGFGTAHSSEMAPRGFGGTTRSAGSFGSNRSFGSTTATNRSFGSSTRSFGSSTRSFGSTSSSGGSRSFGSAPTTRSFGGGQPSGGGSFGGGRSAGGSFGGGGSHFSGGGSVGGGGGHAGGGGGHR